MVVIGRSLGSDGAYFDFEEVFGRSVDLFKRLLSALW